MINKIMYRLSGGLVGYKDFIKIQDVKFAYREENGVDFLLVYFQPHFNTPVKFRFVLSNDQVYTLKHILTEDQFVMKANDYYENKLVMIFDNDDDTPILKFKLCVETIKVLLLTPDEKDRLKNFILLLK